MSHGRGENRVKAKSVAVPAVGHCVRCPPRLVARMGYDVHITRKNDWFDEEPQIAATEWLAYLKSDPSMRLDGYAETVVPGGDTLRYENEGLAVWIGYSRHEPQGNMAWFDFRNGDLVVKNPDPEIRKKMWLIAQALGAKVQGDEGETYDEDGSVVGR